MSDQAKEVWKNIIEMVVWILFVWIVVRLLLKFVVANEQVFGPSMQPTFHQGDRVIALRHKTVKRNDVVILDAPDEPGELYIKRVIGLPGETVESKNDKMYINGKYLAQPYLKEYKSKMPAGQLLTNNFTLKNDTATNRNTVPKDSYFVMGDNRTVSKDSRMIGFIKKKKIEGVVVLRYWPLNRFKIF